MGSYSRGRICGGGVGLGAYIRDVNQVTTYSLGGGGGVYIRRGAYIWGRINGILRYTKKDFWKKKFFLHNKVL